MSLTHSMTFTDDHMYRWSSLTQRHDGWSSVLTSVRRRLSSSSIIPRSSCSVEHSVLVLSLGFIPRAPAL